jgi:hypothetical protein
MSNIAENIKAGVKGIRGAGDVLRGEVLDTTDKIFDNPNHPTSVDRESKNRLTAEKGRQDIRNADETFAKHEWERKGVVPAEGVTHQPSGANINTGISAPGTATTTEAPAHNVESTAATHAGQPTETGIGHQTAPNFRY